MDTAAKMIAEIAAPVYLAVGLSMLLYMKQWQKLMDKWKKDHLSLFPLMVLYPILGMIVIKMYNVWEWKVELLVTLIGWTLLVKGILYFLLPGSVLRTAFDMKKNTGLMYLGALLALVFGSVLGYYAYFV